VGVAFGLTSNDDGYLGLGWSGDGKMVGSHAVIGTTNKDDSGPSVESYLMNSKAYSSFTSSSVVIKDVSIEVDNGIQTVRFFRDFTPDWDGKGVQSLIYAIGSAPKLSVHQRSGVIKLDLAAGTAEATATESKETVYTVHGTLMTVAWGGLIPFGILAARYMDRGAGPLWIKIHKASQVSGLLIALGAWIIAIVDFDTAAGEAHGIIGLIVMVLGLLQPMNAFVRPHPGYEHKWRKEWEMLHKFSGRGAVVLALVNCFLGLDRFFALLPTIGGIGSQAYYILLGVWIIVMGCVAAFLEVKKFQAKATKEGEKAKKNIELQADMQA